MLLILLSTLATTAYGEGYAAPPHPSVAPAPAAYGSPYTSNSISAPSQSLQYQPYPAFIQQPQPIPIGVQHVGVAGYPMGYGMFGASQMGQSPYQMYTQQPLPSSLYVSYPQNVETVGTVRQTQQTTVPSSASTYFTLPTAASTAASSGYASPATAAANIGESTLTLPRGFTPASATDPWAALSGVTTKKAENRKKKDGEGMLI
ncbi:hypothetical protein Y032_0085g1883 [Ancylostoma ceylanicum]|uniref:Uncharacterized protein n=1 Tax=Ancylostoma ceylanicum TaxID=53326 RepID=A0A016TPK1_9BILA|nr:hypothetical protein Y032_0085g1883 [Ancylostoma ceylanicum]